MSVRLSVPVEQLGSTVRILMTVDVLGFAKMCRGVSDLVKICQE